MTRAAPALLATLLCCISNPGFAQGGSAEVKPAAARPAAAKAKCVFPDNPRERAAAWVCSQETKNSPVAAVGSNGSQGAAVQFKKDQAVASARIALAKALSRHADEKVKAYAKNVGKTASPSGAQLMTPAFEESARVKIVGSRIFQQATSRKKTIYVLVGLEEKDARQAVIDIIQQAIGRDAGAWSSLLAGQSSEALAAAIADTRLTPAKAMAKSKPAAVKK